MVKTSESVLDINNVERIVKLEEITIEKHKTISDKKKELEDYEKKKKKELEDLEKKKEKELKDLEAKRKEVEKLEAENLKDIETNKRLIDDSLQDVIRHKKILSEQEIESKKKATLKTETIDEIAGEKTTASNINPGSSNLNYSRFFENLEEPRRLYDITNNSFYSNLNKMLDKARDGDITREEQVFIENLRSKFDQFGNNDSYVNKDQNAYIKRSMNIIERIGTYVRLKE